VNDYLIEFERLANRIIGFSPTALLSCFISGLYLDLRREVQALQPMSIPQAVALAKLQEEKIQDRLRHSCTSYTPSGLLPSPPPPTTVPSTVKRLSAEELVVRRDKGLCYHCDEKWILSHRCRPRLHLLIADDDDDDCTNLPPTNPHLHNDDHGDPLESLQGPQISLNALAGMLTQETICLYGTIAHHQVIILVDGGNTHNFIQTRLASFLHPTQVPTVAMRVMIGNGSTIDCDTKCPEVPILV